MTVVVLTACPVGLRGHLTRWLLEVSPGVFVGHVSARVRDRLWGRVIELVGSGRAIMVHVARNEQRLDFEVHGHDWEPVDFDGIALMRRPLSGGGEVPKGPTPRDRWSAASRRRRFG